MAVYTDITEAELGAFLAGYDVGELQSYRGIAEGVENSNFLVHTTTGQFILTLYEKRVNEAELPYFLGLMRHLADRGISCPVPVERRDGGTLGTLAGRPAAMVSFLEGIWLRRPQAGHCAEVGRGLAEMHLAGADFAMSRRNGLTLEDWRPLWEKSRAHAADVDTGLAAETEALLRRLEAEWPRDLPGGVIHADLFPDNVFFLGDRLSGFIDFYFACNDALAYDVAVCLNAWCFERDHAFNITKGRALLNAYNAVRPLSDAEIAALPILSAGAALRFMLTRLYDWVMTPEGSLVIKKDPLEYLAKMRFHRAIDTASGYGLD
ncbi:homoserine kinase [Oricola sp.]|uniref:homoserine kinase n=1 Tax=Oricola sp. TaxID=1979950 RepID=UPI003BAADB18